jgi:hypothetical protein
MTAYRKFRKWNTETTTSGFADKKIKNKKNADRPTQLG